MQAEEQLTVKNRKGEPVDKALRKLRRMIDREGVIRDVRDKRYFEKPSRRKYKKKKEQKFRDWLRNKYADQ